MEAVERRFGIAFVVITLALAAGVGMVTRGQRRLQEAAVWESHTCEVLAEIAATQAATNKAQAWLLARNPSMAAPDGRTALTSLPQHADRLAALTMDNPSQLARIDRLRQAFRTLAGPEADRNGAGTDPFENIHSLLVQMTDEEHGLLKTRSAEVQRATRQASRTLVVLASGVVGLLALVYVALSRDLARRRDMFVALRASEERFRLLINSVTDYAIFMLDADGRVVSWNPGARRLKGYEASDVIGRDFSMFYRPEDITAGRPVQNLEAARRDGRYEDESWRVRKDGSQFWASVTLSAVRDERGTLRGFAKVTRDLTHRKQEEETRLQLAQAAEAVRLRDAFLSVAAHELRTPLTPLSLLLQRLDRDLKSKGEPASHAVDRAMRQVHRLERLITDMLDVSRLREGRLQLSEDILDLTRVVSSVIEDFRELSPRHQLTLHAPGPVMVSGDALRLEQVMVNLLQNALKYSPQGGQVNVALSTEGGLARVTIVDHGIGIPADEQSHVFDRFFRARNAETSHFGGLGLGLWLSREIVLRHGGRFEVTSQLGEGSSFSFLVPLAPNVSDQDSRGATILLVDDDDDVRDGLGDALRAAGFTVQTARDGPEALEAIPSLHPDVIMVDLMMPLMDGATLIERVRQVPHANGALICIVSASSQTSATAARLHVDAAFLKPVDLEGMQRTLSTLLSKEQRAH